VDFSQLEYIRDSRILIAECTFFIDEHTDRAEAGRHIHIDDFVRMIEPLRNEHIIITHVTQRTGLGEAQKILRAKLPAETHSRVRFLMDRKWRKKEDI
jgi:ribonuclease BN (tRNA processing enzyme)